MSRSTLISIALCSGVTVALFAWMFSGSPVVSGLNSGLASQGQQQKAIPQPKSVVFSASRSKATALNDVPVNIVIDPATRIVAGQPGKADLVVVSSGLKMREEPSRFSPELGNYSKGARFSFIRDEKGWALVQSLDDGQKGWMFKKYMGNAS